MVRYEELKACILALTDFSESKASVGGQVIELPVLYGGEVDLDPNAPHYDGWDGRETAPDREDVLAHEKITWDEFVHRHSANLCYIYFQAFAIGHSYVGQSGQDLHRSSSDHSADQDTSGLYCHLGGPDGAQWLRSSLWLAGGGPYTRNTL